MENAKLSIIRLSDRLWVLNESGGANVDAYLVVGNKRAALIDALMSIESLWDDIRGITDLPIDVIITHGHGDHIGKAVLELMDKGCPVYMDKKDLAMAEAYLKTDLDDKITDLEGGDILDLGGITLETLALAGHTPGSVVLLDKSNGWLFTGDAIGSGEFWMQLGCCLTLEELADNIEAVLDRVVDLKNLVIHPGHRHQSPCELTLQYIKDVLDCTKGIIEGSITGEAVSMDFHGSKMEYSRTGLGLIQGYCYDPKKLRK